MSAETKAPADPWDPADGTPKYHAGDKIWYTGDRANPSARLTIVDTRFLLSKPHYVMEELGSGFRRLIPEYAIADTERGGARYVPQAAHDRERQEAATRLAAEMQRVRERRQRHAADHDHSH